MRELAALICTSLKSTLHDIDQAVSKLFLCTRFAPTPQHHRQTLTRQSELVSHSRDRLGVRLQGDVEFDGQMRHYGVLYPSGVLRLQQWRRRRQ